MSLLMQALKKAERAKQSSPVEAELDKPSEAFDDILSLAPLDAAPVAAPVSASAPAPVDDKMEFSLEPLASEPPAASLTPRPSPSPLPAPSDHGAPGMTLDLTPDPMAPVVAAAPEQTTLPAEPTTPVKPATPVDAAIPVDAATPVGAATPSSPRKRGSIAAAPQPTAATSAATTAATASAAASAARTTAAASSPAAKPKPDAAADKPTRGAARARAAAAASTAEPAGLDPERLRLIGLLTALALIIAGFGYYYWQAVVAPGAGSRLPPVPMPAPGATGATPVQVIGGNPAGAIDPLAMDASADGMLAPAPLQRSANNDDLERRLARTEEQLAAAQQAIQSQLSAPRVEHLPPVAAPDNNDIRVARAVQPARVTPALESGYQALASGDLTSARGQYDAALRQDANSRDALLGLATVSARQGQNEQAAGYYLRLLELDPNDATAVGGLVGLRAADNGQSESRLKAILNTNPDAGPALFALGNVYAQQSRWSEAQQFYFRAYTAAPDNPDYAYNLAIGLDRLNQGRLALTYYQRALATALDKSASFDRATVRQRIGELGGTVTGAPQ